MAKTEASPTLRAAITTSLDRILEADPEVFLIGEDIAEPGGVFQVTRGLHEKYGSDRVIDTPISELALSAAAFGAAVMGKRPIVEIMFGDFLTLAFDSLVNQSAKYPLFSGGRGSAPLVVRSAVGGGARFGAIHSQVPIPWFLGVPGIKIACPSSATDAPGLLEASVYDDGPVLFLEHKILYGKRDRTGREAGLPLGTAEVVREGSDVTVVSLMKGVVDALDAADELAPDGIDLEVIDLRSAQPMDVATVLTSAARTGRVLIVEEGPRTGGWSAQLGVELLSDGAGFSLRRLTHPDGGIPYSPPLEDGWLPNTNSIARECREMMHAG